MAVAFFPTFKSVPADISSYTSIGISIFKQTYTKIGNNTIATSDKIDLIPCRSNYLSEWLSQNKDQAYYQVSPFGYCVPDGLALSIKGRP